MIIQKRSHCVTLLAIVAGLVPVGTASAEELAQTVL